MLFARKRKPFDRTATLEEAERARIAGRRKKAIGLYRKILAEDPKDLAVHGKIAPLLARSGKKPDALASFRIAGQGQIRAGFVDRAISITRQATEFFPEEIALWEEIARLHLQRGRRGDAVAALVDAGHRLWRGRNREIAAKALRKALEIEPWHPQATLLLARTWAGDGRREEALGLLDGLSLRVRGKLLRRTRRLAFRISPTLSNLWRWIRASFGRR